jgi:hypothetical protein
MIGQFASDLANDHPAQAPAEKAHRTVLRGNVLNDCGEPVSVALRMATVDPEAPDLTNDEAAGGPSGSSTVESAITSVP